MRRVIPLVPLLVALVAVSTTAGGRTPATLEPGDTTITLDHGGRRRSYIVHVPPSGKPTAPRALLLAFHGGGGHAAQFQADAGLDRLADREGFVVVYPNGTGRLAERLLTFNAGKNCCGYAHDQRMDDVGFAAAVIADISERTAIDRSRVYATGHSNGAIMAYRLAAERADLMAAIAPVAGAMSVATFRPSRPVAVMHVHSVDDTRALYEGGLGPPFPGTSRRIAHAPVRQALDQWVGVNGCRSVPNVVDKREAGREMAERLAYGPCESGYDVVHWKLAGAGHGWPGAPVSPLARWVGPPVTVVKAADEIWQFVRRYQR
jgi:polyhydroxybutyrate depolymerase